MFRLHGDAPSLVRSSGLRNPMLRADVLSDQCGMDPVSTVLPGVSTDRPACLRD